MRKQNFFKKIDKKKYVIWADCGLHFRCSEMLHYLLIELANEGVRVDVNFFGEAHGMIIISPFLI
jgi:hypothetical protein